jgi:hypothetical protein
MDLQAALFMKWNLQNLTRNTIGAKAILHGEYGLKNRNVMVVAWEHGHMHGTVVSNYVANNESTPYTFMYSNDEKKKKN